jgi:hypothetical protein
MFMVYLANLVDSLRQLCSIGFFIGTVFAVVYASYWFVASHDHCWRCNCTQRLQEVYKPLFTKFIIVYLRLYFGAAVLFCILPSDKTVYTMLAVGLTQDVMSSPIGQKVLAVVNKHLEAELSEDDKD